MMFSAEFYETLLRDAAFGPLHLGADIDSVLSTTGGLENQSPPGRSMCILSFRSKHLQVTMKDEKVVHFGLYFRHVSQPVTLSGLRLSAETSVVALRRWMKSAGMGAVESVQPDGVILRFDNGVVAVIDDGMLDSLQVS